MLTVSQHPIIDIYQLVRDVMGILDRFYNPHHRRIAMPKFLESIRQRLSRRAMSTAGIG
ncbi:MAG: hypothetical protein HOP17_15740 [Acidobacteria bacterium]|nr:hypothetical protein [Acidobacteriota bacterium]